MIDGFLLKKLASVFVHVIPGVLILLLLALLCRRWLPRLSYALSIVLVLFLIAISLPPVSNHFVARLENTFPPLQQAPADTKLILVLGYGHNEAPGRSPTSILAAGALSRLVEGIRLWRTRPASTLVLSGAGVYGKISHAQVMKAAALSLGVPERSIITFDNTLDTADEISAAIQLMGELRQSETSTARLVVVSSATHLPRASLMLNHRSVDYSMAPTDYLADDSPWYRAGSSGIYHFDRALHEWVGMLWHSIQQIVR
ncbi:MAG: ElyC/SanA/YdcF family protein [Pseudomonadota bacterium]